MLHEPAPILLSSDLHNCAVLRTFAASYSATDAATEALRDSTSLLIGIDASTSHD